MGLAYYLKRAGLGYYLNRLLRLLPSRAAPPQLRMLRKLDAGETLPPAAVSEPYRLRRHAPGDEDRWMELLNASGEFGAWDRRRLQEEMGASLLRDGCVFAEVGDQLVGCASACFLEPYGPYAILMYVAVLPAHRGQGLGRSLVWETLRVAQREKYPGMLLHTDPHRAAAIRTYFRLGFLPQFGKGAAGKRQWSGALARALLEGGA
jgi:ribosomal protein S18 acetylase RimI-like enzyme